ncbi:MULTISPECIES: FAD-binding oxidoreductase [unclassified Acinetobacter]|uniref:FAD-binding oxidoreductase n=1 Tax=unclassified Acinetobacter TaxID=196816 RepID=UPI002934E912|nr:MULTISPECIES: FAD-binding oxidoreductase [unclassified Acinetobacter]WOE31304.1 FAD-binding oxidoreductase [Acinetobacter sp. SAAs470]WOE39500.1 FAD-binding oxidoreductase [Acinetobacter sp. SAAs474]
MQTIQSWGRLSKNKHNIIHLNNTKNITLQLHHHLPGIVYGFGRSYGDVALNRDRNLWLGRGLNHFISFDDHRGILSCEAGCSLQDIQRTLLPRGWMLAVTPGTQMISVGGAIANDVHGKNHHGFGSFGDHILQITLLRTDGELICCSRTMHRELFFATIGGIGLTGIIVEVKIQLRQVTGPWLEAETIPYYNLEQFFELADHSEQAWEHTVSWVDCMHGHQPRGLFMRANLIDIGVKPYPQIKDKTFPITPPVSLVNRLTLPIFNWAYFYGHRLKKDKTLIHYESFFYPLDVVHEWNKMYGPKGFYQYQSVIPRDVGQDATQEMLHAIKKSGEGSFLAVLKTFAARESGGLLSFPQPGVTLALDFPNRGQKTLQLLATLDAIVKEAKGRLYLAKDARMPKSLFEIGYPKFNEFLKYRDPGISSEMSRRLLGV